MHRCRRRPDRTRLMAEFGRDKRCAVEDFAERPGAGRPHYPRNQQIGATGESAADDDPFEIEDLKGHGAGPAEGGAGAIDEVQCDVITRASGLENGGGIERIDPGERTVDARPNAGPGSAHQVVSAALRLQAAVLPARTGVAKGLDGHVADLPRKTRSALVGLPVQHQTSTNPGSGGDEKHVRKAASRAVFHFREGGGGGVVHDAHGDAKRIFKARPGIDVPERGQMGRRSEATGGFVHQSGHRDPGCLRCPTGVEFAPQGRELNAQRLDRLMLHRRLGPAHDLEVKKGHRLDERAADVEAESEHGVEGGGGMLPTPTRGRGSEMAGMEKGKVVATPQQTTRETNSKESTMELDLPMLEIGAAFGRKLDAAERSLHADARKLGAKWLRSRIERSAVLRWNSVRVKSLAQTGKVADYAIKNGSKPVITVAELAEAIRRFGGSYGRGWILMEECPF